MIRKLSPDSRGTVVTIVAAGLVCALALVTLVGPASARKRRAKPVQFRAHQSGLAITQVTAAATFLPIVLNVEDFDTARAFNPATGSFVAPKSGRYHFDGRVGISSGAQRRVIVTLFVDGVERSRGEDNWLATNLVVSGYSVSDTLSLAKGDVVTLQLWESVGGAAVDQTAPFLTRFSGYLVK